MISQARFYFCVSRLKSIPTCSNLISHIRQSFVRHPRFTAGKFSARFQASLAQEATEQPDDASIEDTSTARTIIENLSPDERLRLQNALIDTTVTTGHTTSDPSCVRIERDQAKQLLIVSTLPFIGFGFLDNFLMIIAAEYIENSLGVLLTISTMAAAGLGHIVADVAGIGLTHYVEFLVSKARIKHPVLTAQQLESAQARRIVNTGRLVGLVIGCLIGMFPLLFYEDPKRKAS